MKKILSTLFCLVFVVNIVLARDVFLTLTKHDNSAKKLPINVSVITQKTVEEKHFETLGELLQNEVSVNFRSVGTVGANTSISIRGASSLHTLVLINGRRVNDIGLGSVDFTSIPANIIERVEIIRGSGTAVHGAGAFGGVVNVITKKATETAPIVDFVVSYGSFNTLNPVLTVACATDKYGAFASVSSISSTGYRKNSKFTNVNAFFSGQLNVSEKSKLSLSGNVYESKCGVPGPLSYFTPKNEQEDDNKYIKFDYDFSISDTGFLNVSGYLSDNIRLFYDANGNPYDSVVFAESKYKYTSDIYGVHADIHYKEIALIGLEFENKYYKENEDLSGYSLDKSMRNYAFYTKLTSQVGKVIIISAMRYDNNSQYQNVFIPSISAIFNADKRVKISANIGKVWRAPVFTELYWNQSSYRMYGEANLKPEHGISSDIGIEYSHNKLRLAGNAYYIDGKDLINWYYSANGEFQVKNIDKARQYGFEFEAVYIVMPFLDFRLNYTYLKSENKKTKKILAYNPKNTVNCGVTVKPMKNLSVSANLFYKDEVFANDANTQSLDSFITLSMDLNYKINDNLSLWVKGLNVGSANYELIADYPMHGTAIYVGVNVKMFK
ncbi:TonB-dependent receptor plug domain-containing protein [Candidatus Endomicrobiellum agilis]|uniref:TonB-dependent receptor plug domain-containing protein n=1 Tax=Candidatus Endomicrobiellum agilis TaxID=3238957 RepID=UPI00357F6EE8|nr:TonB-dependent receptor [Endomicrobium sp.]